MHIGISRPPAPPFPITDVDGGEIARIAEDLGFESVFYAEHPIRPADGKGYSVHASGVPFFQDTLVALARASAMTSKIKLGSGVFVMPLHQPVLFAKQLASLDFYSGGRLILGVGVGWNRIECEAMGGNFDRRWAQAREAIQLMKLLWTEDVAEFHGEFYDFPPVSLYPQPVTKPWPPVLLPGPPFDADAPMDSPRCRLAFKRIVTFGDGWIPGRVGLEQMRSGPELIVAGRKVIDRLCAELGRDPREIRINVLLRTEVQDGDLRWPEIANRDILRRYEDIGVERTLVTVPTVTSVEHAREVLTRVAESVL